MVEYTAAGCVAGSGTFAKRTCSTTCQWGGYSATCAAPINDIVLEISPTIGQTASVDITFSSAKMGDRLYAHDTCPIPAGNSLTKGDYPYQYVEIKNATATAATVTLFASAAAGAPAMDTVMAAYGTPLQPMDDTARRACAWGVDDDSESSDPTGSTGFSILKAVPIAAHSSILVYVASYYDLTNTGTVQTGPLKVNVKTDAL
jgi:hypothetical protein